MYTYQPLTLEQAQVCPSALSGLTMSEYVQRRAYARDHYQELQTKRFDWWQTASTSVVVRYIEKHGDAFANELCILLCAKSVEHLSTSPRIGDCWRTRLAWVYGYVSDEARQLDMENISARYMGDRTFTARAVAEDTLEGASWWTARASCSYPNTPPAFITLAKLAGLLRTIVQSPEPHSLELPVLLARWPEALKQAQTLLLNDCEEGQNSWWSTP